MEQLKYYLGATLLSPLFPMMYWQGVQIQKNIPDLPNASKPQGKASHVEAKITKKIIIIGESTMAGVGVQQHIQGFAGHFAARMATKYFAAIEWKVFAISGMTARELRQDILPKIAQQKADLIVVGTGANDAFKLRAPQQFIREIKKLVEDIEGRFPNTPMAFLNMPPIRSFPAFTPLIQFTLGNLVEMYGDALVPLFEPKANIYYSNRKLSLVDWAERHQVPMDVELFFSDGVHPSGLTYQLWAEDFVQFLLTTDLWKS